MFRPTKAYKHGSGHSSRHSTTNVSNKFSTRVQQDGVSAALPVSFLFVVNEFVVDYEPLGQGPPMTDQWCNIVPPLQSQAYLSEVPGTVFRYLNGVISPALDYRWYREAMGVQGHIVRVDADSQITGYPAPYRSNTVFACSALLPMIVTDGDASLGYSFLRRLCPCDSHYSSHSAWCYLHFGSNNNVSMVYSGAVGEPWVAGRDASWIPALVPSAYKNTNPSAPPSRGLSGHLSILLALMGFHGGPGRASHVFHERRWNHHQWEGSSRASNYLPKAGERPRGLFVQVCADNLVPGQPDDDQLNIPMKIWMDNLERLEYHTILVNERS
ncbi:hypothetical protein VTJ49DRAFT_4221 [Mycothermus thermophilus]|uniref:Uncharacterized protein n=1 Tax=Humicola insolens TaxID=85995 RepID=A0ABR3V6E3_HUMIN